MKKLLFFTCIISCTFNLSAQCDSTLPVTENFDTDVINVCWNIEDGDGDNNNWMWWEYSAYYGGHKVIASYSYYTSTGALYPDNWIMSNAIDLTSFNTSQEIELSWKVRGELSYLSHEYYTAYVATGNQINDFESSPVQRGEYADEVGGAGVFVTRTLDVSTLAGNIIYIAFRHHNSTNQSDINIDNVSVSTRTLEECLSDADNDGVCDAEDQCPGLNDALIGTSCDDGDPCTTNDIYDSNCGCSGTISDSDNDGVCDAYDECPGFDDSVDTNGNGVPDGCETSTCQTYTDNFSGNSLSHSGSGSNSSSLSFPSESKDVSFTISGIGQKLKGKASSKYIEHVVVSFQDGTGTTRTYGTYSGANVNSANVNISGFVQSVSVSLSDELNGNTSSNMNINFGAITYCSTSSQCTDSDNDGVCDADDQCPGFDDNIDTNNNGVPDGCESSGCQESSDDFPSNPLTHSGNGSNSTTLNLPANSQDVSFSISSIGQKLKGKASSKYIEKVVVTYKDGAETSQTYGTYSGASVNSASINIQGNVQSITISLSDEYNGTTSSNMNINFSTVTYCINSAQARSNESLEGLTESLEMKVFPNPASHTLFVEGDVLIETNANITLYNIKGIQVRNVQLNGQYNKAQIDLNGLIGGLYLLRIVDEQGNVLKAQRIVVK